MGNGLDCGHHTPPCDPALALLVLGAAVVWGSPGAPPILLVDVTPSSGIAFRLEHHPTPDKHLIETMPGGLAALDYNNDGLVDLYFTNGASVPDLVKTGSAYWNRLYRNEGGRK